MVIVRQSSQVKQATTIMQVANSEINYRFDWTMQTFNMLMSNDNSSTHDKISISYLLMLRLPPNLGVHASYSL